MESSTWLKRPALKSKPNDFEKPSARASAETKRPRTINVSGHGLRKILFTAKTPRHQENIDQNDFCRTPKNPSGCLGDLAVESGFRNGWPRDNPGIRLNKKTLLAAKAGQKGFGVGRVTWGLIEDSWRAIPTRPGCTNSRCCRS